MTRRPGAWGQLRGPRALDGGHNKIGNLEAISQILTLFPLLLSCQLRDFAKFQCQEMTPTRDYSLLKVPNTSALLSLSTVPRWRWVLCGGPGQDSCGTSVSAVTQRSG